MSAPAPGKASPVPPPRRSEPRPPSPALRPSLHRMIVGTALVATALAALPVQPAAVPQNHHRAPQAHLGTRLIRPGDTGPQVRKLQTRLRDLHYDPGAITGRFGGDTRTAVWAFQKVNKMKPDGVVTARTWTALARPRQPRSIVGHNPPNRVEINLRKQLLVAYRHGEPALISHISTGSGAYYCGATGCGTAHTPTGDFRVTHRIRGWHRSALGYMYRPLYFFQGYAMHGSTRVPLHPASHGCVRLPLHTADVLPHLVGNNERVYVRG